MYSVYKKKIEVDLMSYCYLGFLKYFCRYSGINMLMEFD